MAPVGKIYKLGRKQRYKMVQSVMRINNVCKKKLRVIPPKLTFKQKSTTALIVHNQVRIMGVLSEADQCFLT